MTRATVTATRLLVALTCAALLMLVALPLLAGLARAQAPAAAPVVEVGVIDDDGELTESDRETLLRETVRIPFPVQVERVQYLLFGSGEDNLNDTVERFAQAQRPDLLAGEADKWAPGTLLVAVSLDPRRNGIYCGDDVCAALDVFEGPHLDGALEAMKDPLRRDNYAMGLLAGAQAAADPTVVLEQEPTPAWVWWAAGGAGAAAVGGIGWAVAHTRKKKAATARERFDRISREYGRIAGELTGIDVRANSLTSPLADDELRSQWEDVKQRFLEVDTVMGRIGHLRPDSTDAEFREAAGDIETAHETVDQMDRAEKNIDEMFRMEQGDADVRRRQLGELRKDMVSAALGTSDERLAGRAEELQERVDALAADTSAPDFMDRYARIMVDYRLVVEAIRAKEMADVTAAEDADSRHAPRLYDSDWRVGHGYGGFVPYYMVSTWHTQDVQAAQSASSTNTSYSNTSFSGGGGSSSW